VQQITKLVYLAIRVERSSPIQKFIIHNKPERIVSK